VASITKVSTGWRARYRAPDGASRSRTFPRKVDAERFLTTMEASKLTGAYVDPSAGRLTLGAYAEDWLASRVHRPSTAARVTSDLRTHILPALGNRPLAQLRHSEIQAAVKAWSTVLSPTSVPNVYRTISAICAAAVRDRAIGANPCEGVVLPRRPGGEMVPPTLEQVRSLIGAMPERYRVAGALAAGAGLRQGEALGVTVDRIDFLRRRLVVDRQMVTPPAGEPALAPPKSDASYRTVPLADPVLDALADHLQRFPPGEDGLVITYHDGRAVRRNRFGAMWRQSCARAELTFRYHDLRHHFASLLIAGGESVVAVQRVLGHASAKVTLDTYGHLFPDAEDHTRAVLNAALSSWCVTGVSFTLGPEAETAGQAT
jgi:integrase